MVAGTGGVSGCYNWGVCWLLGGERIGSGYLMLDERRSLYLLKRGREGRGFLGCCLFLFFFFFFFLFLERNIPRVVERKGTACGEREVWMGRKGMA